ncbi:hypothetical protein MJD09_27585, partial [bacterium]|nr:hypothetical protein [bacterium]
SRWRALGVNPDKAQILSASQERRTEDLQILRALYDGELNYPDQDRRTTAILRITGTHGRYGGRDIFRSRRQSWRT